MNNFINDKHISVLSPSLFIRLVLKKTLILRKVVEVLNLSHMHVCFNLSHVNLCLKAQVKRLKMKLINKYIS